MGQKGKGDGHGFREKKYIYVFETLFGGTNKKLGDSFDQEKGWFQLSPSFLARETRGGRHCSEPPSGRKVLLLRRQQQLAGSPQVSSPTGRCPSRGEPLARDGTHSWAAASSDWRGAAKESALLPQAATAWRSHPTVRAPAKVAEASITAQLLSLSSSAFLSPPFPWVLITVKP